MGQRKYRLQDIDSILTQTRVQSLHSHQNGWTSKQMPRREGGCRSRPDAAGYSESYDNARRRCQTSLEQRILAEQDPLTAG